MLQDSFAVAPMLRLSGMFGLGILFLLISPNLRGSVAGIFDACASFVAQNSPLSYVGLGVLALAGMMFMVYRAAQPR